MEEGKLKKAEQVHLDGIALKPDSSERYRGYAVFLSDIGRKVEAQKMYRKSDALKRIH